MLVHGDGEEVFLYDVQILAKKGRWAVKDGLYDAVFTKEDEAWILTKPQPRLIRLTNLTAKAKVDQFGPSAGFEFPSALKALPNGSMIAYREEDDHFVQILEKGKSIEFLTQPLGGSVRASLADIRTSVDGVEALFTDPDSKVLTRSFAKARPVEYDSIPKGVAEAQILPDDSGVVAVDREGKVLISRDKSWRQIGKLLLGGGNNPRAEIRCSEGGIAVWSDYNLLAFDSNHKLMGSWAPPLGDVQSAYVLKSGVVIVGYSRSKGYLARLKFGP